MTSKNTKKAWLLSCLSLLLCFSMLVGSTFAWFTDSATTAVNKIQAGTLDVVLEMSVDGVNWEDAEGKTLDFIKAEDGKGEEILWEPGCTYNLPLLRLRNNGNLALKYEINITGIDGDAELNEAIEWTYDYNGKTEYSANGFILPGNTSEIIAIQGHMKEDAGNEYQGLSIDGISVTVFATQYTYEYDSNDNQYDVDAPALISINGKSYKTLNEAIEAAAEGDVITVGGYVTYDMGNTTGGKDWSKVSIVAETDSGLVPTIAFTGYGSANPLKNATVSGVKIVDNTVGDVESAWEHGYFEVEGGTYTNVEFVNVVQANGTVTFDNCTFNGNANEYAAWVNSGNATFKNCTFVGARGLKAHEAYGSEVAAVTVEGCAFNAMSKKPGIALGDLNADTTVTLKNNTFTDTQPGDGAYIKNHGVPYQYETDTDVTTFTFVAEGNTTILNVYTAADLWEITNVSNRVTEAGALDTNIPRYQFEGVTINIMADIDLENAEWRPICQYPDHPGFKGTINGNGHTISNLNCYGMWGSTSVDTNRHCQGFIGYAASGAVIKDLKFVDANVFSANSICGVVVANSLGGVTIDNCHVDGAVMESNYYIAGICGKLGNGDKVTNCTVKNVTVKSWYQNSPENYSGAIYGSINNNGTVEVTDCTWENVVVQYVADTNGDGVKEVITSVDATH